MKNERERLRYLNLEFNALIDCRLAHIVATHGKDAKLINVITAQIGNMDPGVPVTPQTFVLPNGLHRYFHTITQRNNPARTVLRNRLRNIMRAKILRLVDPSTPMLFPAATTAIAARFDRFFALVRRVADINRRVHQRFYTELIPARAALV